MSTSYSTSQVVGVAASQVKVGMVIAPFGRVSTVTHTCKSRRTQGSYKIQAVGADGVTQEYEYRSSEVVPQ